MKREIIEPKTVSKPAAPYAAAIKVKSAGNLIFLAGVAPNDINGKIVHKGDIVGQTRQVIKNITAALEAAGAKPGDVVMTTTYVVESAMKDFLESGAAIECLAPFSTPTDTLVGVACLAGSKDGQLIEITTIAATA